jgi:hypothetical protein
MTDVLGPTFALELEAAGITGITWFPATGEIEWRERLTAEENATLDEVIAAHDPSKQLPTPPTYAELLQRLTKLERGIS